MTKKPRALIQAGDRGESKREEFKLREKAFGIGGL